MHGRFDLDGGPAQAAIRRQGQRVESVAFAEGVGIFPARRGIGNHDGENSAAREWMQQGRFFRAVIFLPFVFAAHLVVQRRFRRNCFMEIK